MKKDENDRRRSYLQSEFLVPARVQRLRPDGSGTDKFGGNSARDGISTSVAAAGDCVPPLKAQPEAGERKENEGLAGGGNDRPHHLPVMLPQFLVVASFVLRRIQVGSAVGEGSAGGHSRRERGRLPERLRRQGRRVPRLDAEHAVRVAET